MYKTASFLSPGEYLSGNVAGGYLLPVKNPATCGLQSLAASKSTLAAT
jgi:hypothetical protein